jgi:RNA polymerase sigma factor (TIGR02999 family)
MPTPHEITLLLNRINNGSREAMDELMPLVYDELRRIARIHLSHERANHTLQPTALVNEAYLKLAGQHSAQWKGRLHFLCTAATIMRRILIDHAKARHRERRGGAGQQRIVLDDIAGSLADPSAAGDGGAVEVLAVHEALDKLAALDAEQARVVELRYFAGLTNEEIAEVLKLSVPTIKRYMNSAKAFIKAEMNRPRGNSRDS